MAISLCILMRNRILLVHVGMLPLSKRLARLLGETMDWTFFWRSIPLFLCKIPPFTILCRFSAVNSAEYKGDPLHYGASCYLKHEYHLAIITGSQYLPVKITYPIFTDFQCCVPVRHLSCWEVQAIGEFIDDTEDYVNITLDSHRNQLIQVPLPALFPAHLHSNFSGVLPCTAWICMWFRRS